MARLQLLVPACAILAAAAIASPIRVILDTDIGDDFDDTWALHLILARPDVYKVELVQVSTYNTTMRAQVAANIMDTLNRTDVPLGIGKYTGEKPMSQYSIAANYDLNTYIEHGGEIFNGTDRMGEIMASATPWDPVYIIEIAPATSLGGILMSSPPSISSNCAVVAMSGSIYNGYGNGSVSAEYNVHEDITASQAVYNASWLFPLVTAPLDTTVWDQFMLPIYSLLLAANASGGASPYASSLMANYEAWYNGGGKGFSAIKPFTLTTGTSTLYDVQAAYMAGAYGGWRAANHVDAVTGQAVPPAFPNIVTQALPVAVDSQGYTRIMQPGTAQMVYPAISFAGGVDVGVNAMAADIIGSIVAAPLGR